MTSDLEILRGNAKRIKDVAYNYLETECIQEGIQLLKIYDQLNEFIKKEEMTGLGALFG